jgi:hypothetical protein
VQFRPTPRWWATTFLILAAALGVSACSGEIECKTEVTTGAASFTGKSAGKTETEALRRESVREACRQKCAAEKAPMIDACASICAADVAAQKLGGRTTCGRR